MSDPKRDAWLDFYNDAPPELRKMIGPSLKTLQKNPAALEKARQEVQKAVDEFDKTMPSPVGEWKAFRDSCDYLLQLLEESD